MTGIDHHLQVNHSPSDRKSLYLVGLRSQMSDRAMEGGVSPYLDGSNHRSAPVEKRLCYPIVGMITVPVTDEEHIALIDDPKGGLWTRVCDRISIFVNRWIS